MKLRNVVSMVTILFSATHAQAAFSPAPGYSATKLYDSSGTFETCAGLDIYAGNLYFGQFDDVMSLKLSDNSTVSAGTLPPNIGNSAVVVKSDGTIYTSFGTSFNSPYPYKMGYIDGNSNYQNQLDMDGIYDAAVNSNGDLFIVSSPGAAGSKIFQYDWSNGITTEIADIGGYAGGMAFDSDDNLYYADQGIFEVRDAGILKFTSAQVAAGGLDAGDGTVVLSITCGYLEIDSVADDILYATTGWGGTLAKYDLTSGTKIEDIAYGGIGQIVSYDSALYVIDTDWSAYASTIQHVVPEPLEVPMKFTPQALNPKSKGKWVKAHFVLPEGFAITDVDCNSPASLEPMGIPSEYIDAFTNEDGLVEVEIAFARGALCGTPTDNEPMEVTVFALLSSGRYFYGTDTIKIISNNFKSLAVLVSHWLEIDCGRPDWCEGGDVNQDSVVDMADFAMFDGCCIEAIEQ